MAMRQRGFTMVELIIVIIVMAIVATISVRFVTLSTQGAIDNSVRQRLAQAAAVINAQVSRALRNALPGSVRELDGGRCIEWIPIEAASVYLSVPINTAANTFEAVAYRPGSDVGGRIAVYPIAGNPYDLTSPGVVSPNATVPAGSGQVTVSLDANHRFVTDSPTRRFFLIDSPRTFCQGSGSAFLYRYQGYGFNGTAAGTLANLPTTFGGGRSVIGARLEVGSVNFSYQAPTLTRNGVVAFQYTLVDEASDETLAVSQEVQVRNVP
ncbi:prepilin-type N-terminal cleavage/methylation domain-containing protein [Marinobacteraceae bacterium S3BR75-40.1]